MNTIKLSLFKDFESSSKFTENFNSKDVLSFVQDAMLKHYEIPPSVNVRLWVCQYIHAKPLPLNVDKSLKDEKIKSGQCIVIETQKPDGSWSGTRTLKSNSYLSEKITGHTGPTKPGLCGLVNLGNTCFMNSVLQCLSHCPPLSEYFLNNNYLDDLKPDGMEVDLCRAFGELLKAMWSGEYTDVSPTTFKWKVGKYAGQFVGFQQHDAQEFLTFLLDGLHEAINRAKKENKPSDSNHKSSNNESEMREKPDQEVAKETWESYLRKSDSIIVDTFHGLLKSSVVCPVCETVSVTFDPLCYMTLPLPQDSDCVLNVLHVPYDQDAKMVGYRITASKLGTVRDVVSKVAERVNKNADSFILAEVLNNHFHRFFSLNDSIDKIDRVRINLMAYDVPVSVNDSQYTIVPVCHWETESSLDSSGHSSSSTCTGYSKSSVFGIPFVVALPTSPCTYDTVYKLIYERIGRFICKKGGDMCDDEIMNSDSENGINTNDELFNLYIVNGQNPSEAKIIPNDENLLKFPEYLGKQFLALQWTAKSRREFYKCDPSKYQNVLNPQFKSKLQLQDCLSIFMSTEKLGANDTWNCPKCKVSRRATKKFDLWELPNVLIILLKRFTFNRGETIGRGMYMDSCREDKLNANVEFPMTNFYLNDYLINKDHPPVSYDLCGVINHYGTLSGGHYTAYAKHKEDKKWYCFDDSRVYPESEENVMSMSAYILFYIQNDNIKQK